MTDIEVRETTTEAETRAVYPVMRQLRPHLDEDDFVEAVGRMRGEGYRLAAACSGGRPVGAAGFRVQEYLAHGKHLYVDDLVTSDDARSGGVGKAMLGWLEDEARRVGCKSLQLDSGVGRKDAHRFYFRERMTIASYHFTKEL
ncbi:GNAT family N-acetyltransferase [Rubrobacter indicoceani]|uniref:GNAT family N-acetyltransferase n=1 Tax=Rubrobacter indicoceani TaxID=2051957 RepID=UPI001968C1FD|nr:GNAT family N-acetyltransferase [Rubrobacter indicoceani]